MTNLDFDEWLAAHFARFTGCASWLSKFPTTPRHLGDPTQKSVIDGWRDVLRSAELKHAKAASQLLAVGEESFPDRGYDCHPQTVRRIALRLGGVERQDQKRKPKFIGDEEVFDCEIGCKDSGLITLWHPTALKFFKDEFIEKPPFDWKRWHGDIRAQQAMRRGNLYEACVVLCTCPIGMAKKSSMQRYNTERHILFRDGDPRVAMKEFSNTPAGGWGLDEDF